MLLVFLTETLLACSCAPVSWAPACQLIAEVPVVFLGTVGSAEPDPAHPNVPFLRVYRFKVERAYKGLSPETKEIVIDPENFTSCRREYQVGKRYLIFAVSWSSNNPDRTVYMSGECSGSRPAEFAAKDLAFLDNFKLGRSPTRIYGKTLQWVERFGRSDPKEDAPAAGAQVTLRSDNTSRETVSAPDGTYAFDELDPGTYTLDASLRNFVPTLPTQTVEVRKGGCVESLIELKSHTGLSGQVKSYSGRPMGATRVELLHKNIAGQWHAAPEFWAQTDRFGRFKFAGIPTGEYLLGYEISRGKAGFDSPIATTYYPGVSDRNKSLTINIAPNQLVQNLTLRLPHPQTPRRLTVRVTWPDRRPPGPNLLQVFVDDQLLKNIGGHSFAKRPHAAEKRHDSPNSNTVTFTGYQERQYEISARYWVDDLGGSVPPDRQRLSTTNVVVIHPGTRPATARLILGTPKLADR